MIIKSRKKIDTDICSKENMLQKNERKNVR